MTITFATLTAAQEAAIRSKGLEVCAWAVAHKNDIHYTEGPKRAMGESVAPFTLPLYADCSMFAADVYDWTYKLLGITGGLDPLLEHFNGTGYTGTEIGLQQVDQAHLLPLDLCVYFDGHGWAAANSVHTSIVISGGPDPLTCSHGWEGAPEYVHCSQDGRPHRFYRALPAPAAPTPVVLAMPIPKGSPKPSDLVAAKLEALANPHDAAIAVANGYVLYYWSQGHNPPFVGQINGRPTGVALFASVNWRKPKPHAGS